MVNLESFEGPAARFAVLGDRGRLAILNLLTGEPKGMTVTAIQVGLGSLSQPTISHHLRLLENAGFVTRSRNHNGSRTTLCKISKSGVKSMNDWLRSLQAGRTAVPEAQFSGAEE